MKRWIVLLVVGLAIVLLISPGIVGRLAERNLDVGLAQIDLDSPSIDIQTESFERGWFSSAGRHRIDLRDGMLAELLRGSASATAEPALVVETRLDHGLVPVSSMQRDRGTLSPALASAVSTVALDPGDGELTPLPGHIFSFIGLGGSASYRFLLEPGQHSAPGLAVDWTHADLVVSLSPDGRRQEVDGVVESGMVMRLDDAVTTLGRANFAGYLDRREHPAGDFEFKAELEPLSVALADRALGSARSDTANANTLSIGPISIDARQAVDDGLMDGHVHLDVVADQLPEFRDVTGVLRAEYSELNADAFAALLSVWQSMNDDDERGYRDYDSFSSLETPLRNLAAGGGRIEISELAVTLPEGDWRLTLDAEVPRSRDPMPAWPSLLLKSDTRAELQVSASLFEHYAALNPRLKAAVAGGFLVADGDGYTMLAELSDGRLLINGAPLPLDALIGASR